MKRISSSWTLILKIFLPVFWLSFFLPFSMALLFSRTVKELFQNQFFPIAVILFLVAGISFFYFTTWRLQRIDVDEDFIYASNYFRTVKFPYSYVADIQETDLFLFKLFKIELPQKGRLGKTIFFLESGRVFRELIKEHPERFQFLQSD